MSKLSGALPKAWIFPKGLAGTQTAEEKADKHACIQMKNSAVTEDSKKIVKTEKSKLGLKTVCFTVSLLLTRKSIKKKKAMKTKHRL